MDVEAERGASSEQTLAELLAHARALVGVELAELADALGLPVPAGRVRTKGWSGRILELELGVAPGGARGPDFAALGVELKTVPVDAAGVPLESTAVCQIDPVAIAAESWDGSYVRAKLARVLFVALEVPTGARSVGERRVSAVRLWTPDAREERQLRADFELFVRGFFRLGRADDITGHLGTALQVRPKGRNAADTRDGYDADGAPTRVGKCGFYLRPSFVAAILKR
ncbi:MAG TPA: MutH/Sau3AI family endonuclease [Polyangia bacterium]|jgi:DNA mismatch repair protein MutH|nr:MutH/Sau3AI family endonuclease [Polyangia bacterium]